MKVKVTLLIQVCVTLTGFIHSTSIKRQEDSLRCMECHETTSPAKCSKWAMCGQNEICFTREFINQNGAQGFHMGCEDRTRCDLYMSAQSLLGLLGRREAGDLDINADSDTGQPCYQCCTEDDCNSGLCLDSVGNPGGQGNTSTQSGKCPATFTHGQNSCYYIASWNANWQQARSDCHRRAAEMVSVDTQEEHNFLVQQLQLRNSTTYPRYGYWTGGYYVMAMKEWHWLDMTRVSGFTHWGPAQPIAQRYPYNYRIGMVNPVISPTFSGWAWQNYPSSQAMGFICEAAYV